MNLGLILKQQGRNYDALEEFTTVTKLAPDYGEAWKEKGVVEGQIARVIPKGGRPGWLADGRSSLERATRLTPDDFDAWASLGGVFKNVVGDNARALSLYRQASELSNGHPYPLLNALRLEAVALGKLDIDALTAELDKAESMRHAQTITDPPTDTPWCFFDLAEIRLYRKDEKGFLAGLKRGLDTCRVDWEPMTFINSLNVLVKSGIDLPGLDKGIDLLENYLKISGKK